MRRHVRLIGLAACTWLFGSAPAMADPVITPIAIAITTNLPFIAAAVDTFVFFAVQAALYAGTALAITKLTAPSMKGQERQASILQITLGEGPREAIIGEAATAGQLIDAFDKGGKYGTDDECLVIALADHRCEALVGYYIGDAYYEFAGNGVQPGFNGQLTVYFHDGRLDQPVNMALVENTAGRGPIQEWTTDDRLAGVAYVVVFYQVDAPKTDFPVWSTGRPNFIWKVKGARLYDPRKDSTVLGGSGAHRYADPDTWEWSDNPVLARYGYVRGFYAGDQIDDPASLLIGRGLSAYEAPPERVIAHANTCDELVALKAGGTEKRYRANGVIRADEPFASVEEDFAACMAGTIVQREGSIEVEPGVAKSAVVTITDANLIAGYPIRIESFLSENDRVNTVTPRYIEPAMIYRETAAPVRRSTSDLIADGGLKEESLSLSFVTSQTQAQRCGEINRRRGRKERSGSITLGPQYSNLEEGDWLRWTSARYFGGSTITFRIEAHSEDQGLRTGLILRETHATCYSWDAAIDESIPGQAPVDEPGSWEPLELEGVAFAPHSLTGSDGTVTPAVKATWTTPVDAAISGVRVEVRKIGTTDAAFDIASDPAAGKLITSNGVIANASLEARVIPLTPEGRRVAASAWLPVTSGGISLPDLVAAISDGVITPSEKRTLIPQINAIVAARVAIGNKATGLGLTYGSNAERTAYEDAQAALDAYLATLTAPVPWNDSSGRTTVSSPSTFKTRLENALKTEPNLQSAIDGQATLLINTALADSVLTPSEKITITPMINALLNARTPLRNQANTFNLTVGAGSAERIAYENAASALDSLLGSLSTPVYWYNSAGNTTVPSPATFRSVFEAASSTETNLQTRIDKAAYDRLGPWSTETAFTPTIATNKVQKLDSSGHLTTYEGLPSVNDPSGAGVAFSSFPLTSNDSTIYIAGVIVRGFNYSRALPSGACGGLSAGTSYAVFYQWFGNYYIAIGPWAVDLYATSTDQWLFMGIFQTTASSVYLNSVDFYPDGYLGGITNYNNYWM